MAGRNLTQAELDEIDAMLDAPAAERSRPCARIIERRCAQCGRSFVSAPYHVFHDRSHGLWFCKYTCEQAYRRAHRRERGIW